VVGTNLDATHTSRNVEAAPAQVLGPKSIPDRIMWERTLQDLIRGLRANKNDERKFIAQAIEEIRREVKSKDMELKAGAILKMTFVRISSSLMPLSPLAAYISLLVAFILYEMDYIQLLFLLIVGHARLRPHLG
jgi:formate dehydrogenase maturation protein FdhE